MALGWMERPNLLGGAWTRHLHANRSGTLITDGARGRWTHHDLTHSSGRFTSWGGVAGASGVSFPGTMGLRRQIESSILIFIGITELHFRYSGIIKHRIQTRGRASWTDQDLDLRTSHIPARHVVIHTFEESGRSSASYSLSGWD